MHAMQSGLFGFIIALAAVSTSPAVCAENSPVGQIKKTAGTVTLIHLGAASPAKVGDHVFQTDTITTGQASSVGITFLDNSLMALGPKSMLKLDEFRFNSTTHNGVFNSSFEKGTLAVKSGLIVKQAPEAMHIRTPTAFLAVRGTKFVVAVNDSP